MEFIVVLKIQIDAMFKTRLNWDINAQFNGRRRVNNYFYLRQRLANFCNRTFSDF